MLNQERIKREVDSSPCDCCGKPLTIEDRVWVDLETGCIYCGPACMTEGDALQSLPERIRVWVRREFAARYVDRVTCDLIDVAAGNRPGNRFERSALARIFAGSTPAR